MPGGAVAKGPAVYRPDCNAAIVAAMLWLRVPLLRPLAAPALSAFVRGRDLIQRNFNAAAAVLAQVVMYQGQTFIIQVGKHVCN